VQYGQNCASTFWQLSNFLICLLLTLYVANALPLAEYQRLMPAVGIGKLVYETEITKLRKIAIIF
jgi:hypothetical protein